MPRASVRDLIGDSLDEGNAPSERDFVSDVLDLVAQIPPGMVMSYGAVAAALGSRAPRQVGKIMAHYGSTTVDGMPVPWWRVVRADGRPPESHAEAALAHYLDEETPLMSRAHDGPVRVNMKLASEG